MGKAADLSDFDKGQIVMARRLGTSISETARLVGCSRAVVVSTYQKWCRDGETASRRPTVCRPRRIDSRGERRLLRIVRRDRRATTAEITTSYNSGDPDSVSQHTVQRTLLRMGLRCRRPKHVPALTERHRQMRLLWAKKHRNWTPEEWKKVAWSDESRFLVHHLDGRVRIRRFPNEPLAPGCTVGRRQAGGGGIMVWAMFSWGTLGPIIPIEQSLTSVRYLNMVADQVHPFMATVFPAGDGVYQQDNAPCHKGRIVMDWFEEHSSDFQVMSWPPNSPDMNPIEHLWSYLENQIRAATLPPRNVRELQDQLVSAWYQIPQTTYQHLVESMPRRVLAVLRAKGGPTCY